MRNCWACGMVGKHTYYCILWYREQEEKKVQSIFEEDGEKNRQEVRDDIKFWDSIQAFLNSG